jgi:hypothetical protein
MPGEASALSVTASGPLITGILYVGDPAHPDACRCDGCRADRWWFMLETLERSGAHRRVQASVDGKVSKRDRQLDGTADVWECWVEDVALTLNAINTHTWVEIVKSMAAWLTADAQIRKAVTAREQVPIHLYESAPGVLTESDALRFLVESQRLDPRRAVGVVHEVFARLAA